MNERMLVDGHIHFGSIGHHGRLLSDLRRFGAEQFCILVIERYSDAPGAYHLAEGIWLKRREPQRAFLFGGLDFSGLFDGGREPNVPLVEQVETMRAAGFDGLKLLSGKPNVRQALGQPLDGPAFIPLLRWLEATQFPVLWHVGDPPEFWDKDAVPLWARRKGWWYDGDVPPKSQIDREIAAVLAQHRLNLILPHFFFLSDRLDDAAQVLERHPGVHFDLAPGVEMLHNFTSHRSAARDFFVTFADRLVLGTDIGLAGHTTSPERGTMVRRFLETEDRFPVPDDPAMTPDQRPDLHGLGLPVDVVETIGRRNFHRIVGAEKPRPLHRGNTRGIVRALGEDVRRRGGDDALTRTLLDEL